MLTQEELDTYEREGAVTVDGPLTLQELEDAEAAWDRLNAVSSSPVSNDGKVHAPPYEEPAYLSVMAETLACQRTRQLLWTYLCVPLHAQGSISSPPCNTSPHLLFV